jgi:hypothetical protein
MKKVPINRLFSIFQVGDEEVYKEHGVKDVLDNSFVLFGMVIRGVENYYIIDQLYFTRYGEQYLSVRDSIKLQYFNGLVKYLGRINEIEQPIINMLIDEFGEGAIHYAFHEMIDFYVSIEYYEQCSILKKYFDLFSLKKLV